MILAGIMELVLGVAAEGKSLESISPPLVAKKIAAARAKSDQESDQSPPDHDLINQRSVPVLTCRRYPR